MTTNNKPTVAERLLEALNFEGEVDLDRAAKLSGLSIDDAERAARELGDCEYASVFTLVGCDEIVSIKLTDRGRLVARTPRRPIVHTVEIKFTNDNNHGLSKDGLQRLQRMGIRTKPQRKMGTFGSTEYETVVLEFNDAQEDLYAAFVEHCNATLVRWSSAPPAAKE